jgi:hypothetical protein
MRLSFAVCALLLVVLVAGCGAGVKAADLFLIERTGSSPGARLTMLINEEGGVRCNGGPVRKLSDQQLVIAKATQEESEEDSAKHLTLPPRPGSVLSYYVRDESGSMRFADNSAHLPGVLKQLQLLVLQAAQQACHLSE